MLRAALYTRVSTPEQANEGYSLAAQERVLRQYCEMHDYDIYDIYSDEGISGRSLDHRDSMNRMMADAEQRCFDVVLVWKLTRLTRSLLDLCSICELFEDKSISLVSCTESFDATTPSGRMMRGILGVIAQWEREVISENVKLGNVERAQSGKPMCSYVLGYDRVNDDLIINRAEAAAVRFIYSTYLETHCILKTKIICNRLGYIGKKGKPMRTQTIHGILSHSIYAGYNYHAGQIYKGNHEPIISVAVYNSVQQQLMEKTVGRQRKKPLILIPT